MPTVLIIINLDYASGIQGGVMGPSIQLQRAPVLADPRWLHAQTTCAYRCIDLKRCYMYARSSQPVLYTLSFIRSWLKQNAASNSRLMVQWGAKVSLTTGFLSNRDLTHNDKKCFRLQN